MRIIFFLRACCRVKKLKTILELAFFFRPFSLEGNKDLLGQMAHLLKYKKIKSVFRYEYRVP